MAFVSVFTRENPNIIPFLAWQKKRASVIRAEPRSLGTPAKRTPDTPRGCPSFVCRVCVTFMVLCPLLHCELRSHLIKPIARQANPHLAGYDQRSVACRTRCRAFRFITIVFLVCIHPSALSTSSRKLMSPERLNFVSRGANSESKYSLPSRINRTTVPSFAGQVLVTSPCNHRRPSGPVLGFNRAMIISRFFLQDRSMLLRHLPKYHLILCQNLHTFRPCADCLGRVVERGCIFRYTLLCVLVA